VLEERLFHSKSRDISKAELGGLGDEYKGEKNGGRQPQREYAKLLSQQ